MPIRVLPPDVADKIAAGEVIERPVSVAKELIENALDAEADEIRVEIAQGGRRLIRVSDNGCGIPADEVEVAFARHATSKLTRVEDLYRLRTLGFRGEALASIAAVSRLSLSTRASGEELGSLVQWEGGRMSTRQPQGRARGTMVTVENLFFNTPARLKFLRADTTEAGHIAKLVSSYALAFPDKRFSLENNGRSVARTTGTGSLLDVIVALYGLDVAEQMIKVPGRAQEPIRVWGYVSGPSLHRANRQDVIFFVNLRWIQDSSLAYAASEAYRTLLPDGRYPLIVLNVELPPEDVDVNIHPTKREVRFRHSRDVFSAVQKAVRTTLMAHHVVPLMTEGASPGARFPQWGQGARSLTPQQAHMAMEVQRTADRTPLGEAVPNKSPERLPMLRVLGQIALTYIIAEGPGGMYLIDQHAAHERIRYEALKAQAASRQAPAQELLEPISLDLSPQQAALLEEHLDVLEAYGFEITPFGGATFLVKRIPASLADQPIAPAVVEMIDAAAGEGEGFSWEDQALVTLSCHTAVRAGQSLSLDEMRDLVRQLERAELPHTCPHGRPTVIHLTQEQLEKEFGRR